eukprot:TRINITY_DN1293_c0_g1_i1.p1 TRINITY_DN1293_c0_g1~~TRINITY_DN1293_c0_g1_i1.p1  ORF type:complete len:356 (+),score=93.50 TRINITY_DN1293_c0_g1_i1:89-1156(+)
MSCFSFFIFFFFFFFKQKTAYEMLRSLVGSEMCIRDRVSTQSTGTVPKTSMSISAMPRVRAVLTQFINTELIQAAAGYSDVYVVMSPPRCCSTAVARVLWEVPGVTNYSHEPYEPVYYQNASLDVAAQAISQGGIEVGRFKNSSEEREAERGALVIKEMTFQAGEHFNSLLETLGGKPVMFLMRDPRKAISSRLFMKRKGGEADWGEKDGFPANELGWEDLFSQIKQCDQVGYPYFIVDAGDCLKEPISMFDQILRRWSLEFDPKFLEWRDATELLAELDNLSDDGSTHGHLYRHVLESSGFARKSSSDGAKDPAQAWDIGTFPRAVQDHLTWVLGVYQELLAHPRRITPASKCV